MRSSLSLQRSLFRHQARQIAKQVQSASPSFRAYQRRYEQVTRRFRRVIKLSEVDERVSKADLVYVGDYHTLRMAQQAYLALVKSALRSGRRLVLALELIEARHQATLERFLAGRLSEKSFLSRIGHPYRGQFDIWPGFAPILQLAQRRKLEVLAIDRRAAGPRSLQVRDEAAAEPIARAARAKDRPLILALVGQFHVAPCHLPRRVEERLGVTPRKALVIYQNAESIYWSLARSGRVESTRAVEISEKELCLVNTSPVVCQRSFLDYVDAEAGDSPIKESGITHTFRHLVRDVGRFIGIEVGRKPNQVLVLSASDLDALERIQRRGRFSDSELNHLRRHVLSRESAWIPQARAVWLASLSLNHAAEEATHFVRYLCVGDAMVRTRSRADAFWARALEEALGFFGSRLINPKRRCLQLDEWTWHFESGRGELKQVAAFILAISSVLGEAADETSALEILPLSNTSLFHGVSHALGYLLGEALAGALASKEVAAAEIRALFYDAFETPAQTFARFARRLKLFTRRQSARR